MKRRQQKSSQMVEPRVRIPFFAKGLDPQLLRSIRAGEDDIDAVARKVEKDQKLDDPVE